MSDPKVNRTIKRRIRDIIQLMQESCHDCPEKGLLCQKHLEIARDLHLSPKGHLERLEAEFIGKERP